MTNKLILISLIILLFASCKKDKDNIWKNEDTLLISEDVFDYFYSDTGSFWVYTESSTSVKDSNWCTSSSTTIDSLTFSDGTPAGIWEDMFVYVTNNNGDDFTYWARGNDTVDSSTNVKKWKKSSGVNTKTLAAILPFVKDRNSSTSGSNSIVTCDTLLDTLITPAGTFTNVLRYYDDLNATDGNQPTYYYLAKNVGIVRKDLISTSEVWELTNYNVNQP